VFIIPYSLKILNEENGIINGKLITQTAFNQYAILKQGSEFFHTALQFFISSSAFSYYAFGAYLLSKMFVL